MFMGNNPEEIRNNDLFRFAIANANLILDNLEVVTILSDDPAKDEEGIHTIFRMWTKDGKELDLVFKQRLELTYEEQARIMERSREFILPKKNNLPAEP